MNMSGSHSRSSGSSVNDLGSLAPQFPFLASLFGMPTQTDWSGNLAFKPNSRTPNFGGPIIGAQQAQSLGSLMDPIPLGQGEQWAAGGGAADLAAQGVQGIMPSLASTIPGLTRASSADPMNFFGPANALYQDTLARDIFPQIRQGFGDDQFNSDIAFMQSEAGRRGALELAPWAVQSAFDTASTAAPVLALMGSTMGQLPTGTAQDILALGQSGRAAQRAGTEGGSVMDFLAATMGLSTPFGSTGTSTQRSKTDSFGFGIG